MLSVDHRYQRQGIGTNLVFLAEKLTCELGKNLLRLESLDTSVEFYTEFDFRKLYLEQDSYWGTITHMEKQLSC
jgi:predicted N-acetyltransferase YhbS